MHIYMYIYTYNSVMIYDIGGIYHMIHYIFHLIIYFRLQSYIYICIYISSKQATNKHGTYYFSFGKKKIQNVINTLGFFFSVVFSPCDFFPRNSEAWRATFVACEELPAKAGACSCLRGCRVSANPTIFLSNMNMTIYTYGAEGFKGALFLKGVMFVTTIYK